jgi:hypothetical protein
VKDRAMPSHQSQNSGRKLQHGGALLVMLVILVMGITTVFITSLSHVGFKNQRNQNTSDALAIAKEALIGRAVSDDNLPGSLPCPDTNNDGVAELFSGNACPSYLGRLPWKSLGISDLRDGAGERLWYALSPEFRDQTSMPHSLNSETVGSISLSGNVTASNLIAVVIAPGSPLVNQTRPAANENDYNHYLESVVTSPSSFVLNTPDDHTEGVYSYNDQVIFLDHASVMQPVEQRIAREVKLCLDEYAASNPKRNYPWPAKISLDNYVSYYNSTPILFGRIPTLPNVFATDPEALQFIAYLEAVQVALNNYSASVTTETRNALDTAGIALEDYADWCTLTACLTTSDTRDAAENAGELAQDLADGSSSISAVQNEINQTLSELIGDGLISHASISPYSMPTYWPNCQLLNDSSSSAYWNYWRSQVFYQIDYDCRPYWGNCIASGGSLAISRSDHVAAGTYSATVLLARKPLSWQSRTPTNASQYLEGNNVQNETDTTPNTFETYKSSDSDFATNNDLVLCLDGRVNCK